MTMNGNRAAGSLEIAIDLPDQVNDRARKKCVGGVARRTTGNRGKPKVTSHIKHIFLRETTGKKKTYALLQTIEIIPQREGEYVTSCSSVRLAMEFSSQQVAFCVSTEHGTKD
jgi:hypothetical protein